LSRAISGDFLRPRRADSFWQSQCGVDPTDIIRRGGGRFIHFKPTEEPALRFRARFEHDGLVLDGDQRVLVLQSRPRKTIR